jgi:hypothetical protein
MRKLPSSFEDAVALFDYKELRGTSIGLILLTLQARRMLGEFMNTVPLICSKNKTCILLFNSHNVLNLVANSPLRRLSLLPRTKTPRILVCSGKYDGSILYSNIKACSGYTDIQANCPGIFRAYEFILCTSSITLGQSLLLLSKQSFGRQLASSDP